MAKQVVDPAHYHPGGHSMWNLGFTISLKRTQNQASVSNMLCTNLVHVESVSEPTFIRYHGTKTHGPIGRACRTRRCLDQVTMAIEMIIPRECIKQRAMIEQGVMHMEVVPGWKLTAMKVPHARE
jgi:hypothetical protein